MIVQRLSLRYDSSFHFKKMSVSPLFYVLYRELGDALFLKEVTRPLILSKLKNVLFVHWV